MSFGMPDVVLDALERPPGNNIMQTIMHTSCFAPFSNNYYASHYAYKLF
jgi:hypothetical protein